MRRSGALNRWTAATGLAGVFVLAAVSPVVATSSSAASPAASQGGLDACAAPAIEAVAGTEAWRDREALNLQCMRQGSDDANANPEYAAAFDAMRTAWAQEPGHKAEPRGDPLRHPSSQWDGIRGQHRQVWIATPGGGRISAEMFAPLAPCTGRCPKPPKGLRAVKPPYPVVVLLHGGGAVKEMFWNTAEVVAEHGYLVISVDANFDPVSGGAPPNPPPQESGFLVAARSALDYVLATPRRTASTGEHNPWWRLADTEKVGFIGSSLGAVTLGYLGQVDDRVDTVITYDSCEYVLEALGAAGPDPGSIGPGGGGCRSRPSPLRADELRTPRLGFNADYHRPTDIPRDAAPDPHAKDEYTRVLVDQGIDAMQVAVRASAHADVSDDTAGTTGATANSRYGQAVMNYFSLAWLDYQLKGDVRAERVKACRRLTAPTFDEFADAYEIGTGRFEPDAGNVAATVGGLPVKDRLSYLFASTLFLDGGRVHTTDLRTPLRDSACAELSGDR